MTKPDRTPAESGGAPLLKAVLAILAIVVFALALGMIGGLVVAVARNGVISLPKTLGIVALALVLIWGSVAILKDRLAPLLAGPVSAKTRRARWLVGTMFGFGILIGAALQMERGSRGFFLFGEPLPPTAGALAALIAWAVLVPLGTWLWWRQIDEHEALATKDGAFLAINAYSVVFPAWWIGWRGGLFGEPDQMLIFILTLTIWGAVWLVRRFS